jgi:sodium-dependent dicarboxylate transporter 2/3/5
LTGATIEERDVTKDDATSEAAARKAGSASVPILLFGFCLFAVLLFLPPPAEMPSAAWRVAAVGLLMAFLWVTEALPVAVTALLPLVLFPLLGVVKIEDAAAPYADPIIFLFLGGLMLGLALQKWGLHRRIALVIVSRVGLRPGNLVLGFMVATAFISMWVSNTATAAMMLPVTLSMVTLLVGMPDEGRSASKGDRDLVLALLLGVAFAASIGGIGTLIGTPPNALFAGYMRRTYGIEIGFAQWMMLGVPIGAVLLLGTWLILTRIAFRVPSSEAPGTQERLAEEMAKLPRMSRPEKLVGLVFVATAAAWVFRPLLATFLPGLDDTVIAVAAAFALFLIPSGRGGFLLDWKTAAGLPWDVLLLFGGGLSLAAAIGTSGLSSWIGQSLSGLGTMPSIVLVLALVLVTIALSELASNTATAAAFLPLAGSIGGGLGLDPLALTVPVALAASCGYMLPVATPPNALFYGSGYMTVAQMVKAGALVDLLGAALVVAASHSLATIVF